ncbi:MAG: DUF4209 domain-containing protein [Bacteroidota bacterium]|nr:DUF4209 domain-containing protein [Bacteroidota bacterium]
MLRDFARLIKANTIVNDKGIMREMYIEELMAESKVQEYFNEDDLLFFRYLFTSKGGINIRNDIAHAFYRFEHYTFDKMVLVIMAILRLAKYNFK